MTPIFVYTCPNKHEQEEIRRIADAGEPTFCNECGQQMELTPAVPGKFIRGAGSWSTPA